MDEFFIAFFWVAFTWPMLASLENLPTMGICGIIGIFIQTDVKNVCLAAEISHILVYQSLGKV